MRISFVVPAYNEERYLPLCLEAIQKEMARTTSDAEVIVVNNATTDGTEAAAKKFKGVRVGNEMRKGLVRARHAGLEASTGELVANVDADTMLPEGWLATVLKEFEKDPKLAALSGPFIYYDLPVWQRRLSWFYYGIAYYALVVTQALFRRGAMLQGGNFIVRRSMLEKAGGFDTSIEFYGEDADVARRMDAVGKVKWTFQLPIYTSGRRLSYEGILKMGLKYAINFISITFLGKPATMQYVDVREDENGMHAATAGTDK